MLRPRVYVDDLGCYRGHKTRQRRSTHGGMLILSRTSNARGLFLAAPLPLSGELNFAELWGAAADDTIIDGRSWGWRWYSVGGVVFMEW